MRTLLSGLSGDDPLATIGFFRGVFLANHLASTDNLARTTKTEHTATKTNNTQKWALINHNTRIQHAKT